MAARVSVLLPVYDAEKSLAPCLRSVQRQRLQDWECVVVDDGSRDGSAALAASFAAKDARIRILRRSHEGLVAALRAGLAHCEGEWVARMDADDWMHRDRLAAQLAHVETHPELDAVGCHVRLFPRPSLTEGRREYEAWLNAIASPQALRDDAWVECPIAHPTLFVRRALLQHLGYRDCDWPEDYDLVLRMLAAGCRLDVVPRRLLGWRDTPSRLSRTHERYETERFTRCKAAHLCDGFLATSEHYRLWGYGHTGRALRRALAALGRTPSHIVELHPGRLGQRIHGAPVIDPDGLRALDRAPLLVSVAGRAARSEIRSALAEMRYREGRDFLCLA